MKLNLIILLILFGSLNTFAMRAQPGHEILDTTNSDLINMILNKNLVVYKLVSRSHSQNISYKIDEQCTSTAITRVMSITKNPKLSRLKIGCTSSENTPGQECQDPYMFLEYSDIDSQTNYNLDVKCKLTETGRGMRVSI